MRSLKRVVSLLLLGLAGTTAAVGGTSQLFEFGSAGTLVRNSPWLPCAKNWETRVADCTSWLKPLQPGQSKLENSFDHAAVYVQLNAFDLARAAVEAGLRYGKPSVRQTHFAARVYLTGDPRNPTSIQRASELIEAAIKLQPDDADLWTTKAAISQWLSETSAKYLHVDRALRLNPDHIVARKLRAGWLVVEGRADEAFDDLTRLTVLAPTDAFAFDRRSKILMQRGDVEAAEQDLTRAITYGRPEVERYFARSAVRLAAGSFEAAIADLTAILKGPTPDIRFALSSPMILKANMKRGLIHLHRGDKELAQADMMNALQVVDRRHLLQIQAYLYTRGHELPIDGQVSEGLRHAVGHCLNEADCLEEFSVVVDKVSTRPGG